MEVKKLSIDGNKVEFFNDFRPTRNGFAHDTSVFINDEPAMKHTSYYLNRTWERYTYQSVMLGAVGRLMGSLMETEVTAFKRAHNYKRMTEKRTAEFMVELQEDGAYRLYRDIRSALA